MGKKVLFVNQEIMPYVPKTEMSSYGAEMPHIMQEAGFEIRTFMPRWGNINERRGQLHEVIRLSGMELDYRRYRPSIDYQGCKYSADTYTGLLH